MPLKIVSVDILSDGDSGFFDVIVLRQIGFFVLEAAKPTLNHDVVAFVGFHFPSQNQCIADL